MVLMIYAHPYPSLSNINKRLLHHINDFTNISIHSIYDHYPDFNIDVLSEQSTLRAAETVIIQHPLFWYNMPALLKLWFDKVFEFNWINGGQGALVGKKMLWVVTANQVQHAVRQDENFNIDLLSQSLKQIALYCGMQWLPPFLLDGGFNLTKTQLKQKMTAYRRHLITHCHLQHHTHQKQSLGLNSTQ